MAEVLLFHHALGLTTGVRELADSVRAAGHVVHAPDLYDGRVFTDLAEGVAHAESLAGRFAAAERLGRHPVAPPATTALGALLDHITGGHIVTEDEPREDASPRVRSFQPMNINYGLLPPLDDTPTMSADGKRLKGPERGLAKKKLQSQRALADLANWLGASGKSAAAE